MPAVSRPSEFDCKEYGHADIPVQLLLEEDGRLNVYDYLKNTDVYRVSFSKGKMRFTASSYVGVIPLNDHVLLRVKPRIPVANLTHMVVETGRPTLALQALRAYSGHGTAQDWMLDRFAEALIDQVEHVLDQGLHRQYVRRIGTGGYPRGKFDFHQTVARFASRGVNNQAVYEWHERTVDIPPNQCLKAALLALHAHLTRDVRRERMEAGYGSILARLSRQLAAFADVSEIPEHLFINDPEVRGVHPLPEPRYYYRPALDLALLILGGQGIDLGLGGSDAQVSSLLIEMNALF